MDKLYPSLGLYPIPYFILYAIWNLPVRLLTKISFIDGGSFPYALYLYNKLMIVLLMWRTHLSLNKIMYKLNPKEADNVKWSFILMPSTFFVCIIMGMYDIIYVLIVVEALNFYFSDWSIKKNKIIFSLLFGFSICFKSFPMFFYIPLLLIKEKKVLNLIKQMILFVIPFALCIIPYLGSQKFVENCFKMYSSGSQLLFTNKIGFIIPFIVVYILLCCASYLWIDLSKKDWEKWSIIICSLVCAMVMGFGWSRIQWFIIATPFFACLYLYVKKYKVSFIWLQFLIGIFYFWIHFISTKFTQATMINDGILGRFGLKKIDAFSNIFVENIYSIISSDIISSIFFVLMLCQILFCFTNSNDEDNKEIFKPSMLFVSLVGVLSFYFVPLALGFSGLVEKSVYRNDLDLYNPSPQVYEVLKEQSLGQVFDIRKETNITKIKFVPITWDFVYADDEFVNVKILDSYDNVVYSDKIKLKDLKNGQLYEFKVNNLTLQKDSYKLLFELNDVLKENRKLAIKYTRNHEITGTGYSYVYGNNVYEYDMCIEILYK